MFRRICKPPDLTRRNLTQGDIASPNREKTQIVPAPDPTVQAPNSEPHRFPLGDSHRILYKRYEDVMRITRGPEGIYMKPHDVPGFGWDVAALSSM